jgi:hypothetical protein
MHTAQSVLLCCAVLCCVQAQRASLQKKLEERLADLEAKKAALAAVRAGAHAAAGHGWAHEAVCQHTGAVGGRRSAVRGVRLI